MSFDKQIGREGTCLENATWMDVKWLSFGIKSDNLSVGMSIDPGDTECSLAMQFGKNVCMHACNRAIDVHHFNATFQHSFTKCSRSNTIYMRKLVPR